MGHGSLLLKGALVFVGTIIGVLQRILRTSLAKEVIVQHVGDKKEVLKEEEKSETDEGGIDPEFKSHELTA